ncbi:MAG: hypothetical protein WHX53_15880, partial [Anaerolineae bacterium]
MFAVGGVSSQNRTDSRTFTMDDATPSPRPWKLADLTYSAVRQQRYDVAVLPLGATEPHNLHLP